MRLRTILTYCLAAVVCTVAATAASAQAPVPLPQAISDPHGRFALSFPADWEVVTRSQGMLAVLGAGPANAGYRPTVNVVVESLPNPMTPQAYAVAAGRLARTTFHDYTVVQESGASVRGRAAYVRYFTWETNTGVMLYQLQVFFTEGETGFVVTGTTINDRDRILQDMPLITQIIQTFHAGAQ